MKIGQFDLLVLARKAAIGALSAVAAKVATGYVPTSVNDLKELVPYAVAGASAGLGIDLTQFGSWLKAQKA